MPRGERARRTLELGRSHVVCRRIDEVARQRDRFDDALEILAIDALRQIEFDLARFGFAIAREAIGPERESKRRQPGVVRIVGKPINAIGQQLRQTPGKKKILGIVRRFDAEQDSAEAALARAAARYWPGFGSNPAASANARTPALSRSRTSG